ncbi:class I SAM-dependent methyltransferase [Pseudofrankia asymbiotica]|uniref:class I SAM-dependent methyltransferase n=1 Tax=Pseudofrankia asymbiotica TaxID=1834516 RepID=UPI0013041335|nr:class I SAM-dependent methyltransferase [Pseudofrankia asymbiotica]
MDEAVGSGPGAITNDGCPVEFYALLPAFGEAEIVDAAIPRGASVLELGCGTGRILRPLAALGHSVTGVDDSPDMLALSSDLTTVCSPIQSLELNRRFDAVLLTGGLLNVDPALRQRFVAAVRRHLDNDGTAVFQYYTRELLRTFERAEPVWDDPAGFRRVIRAASWNPPCMRFEIEYQSGDSVWTHAWTSYQISDEELAGDLAAADLRFGGWLTDDRTWFVARPV